MATPKAGPGLLGSRLAHQRCVGTPEDCPAGSLGWEEAQELCAHPVTAPDHLLLTPQERGENSHSCFTVEIAAKPGLFFPRDETEWSPLGTNTCRPLRGWALSLLALGPQEAARCLGEGGSGAQATCGSACQ